MAGNEIDLNDGLADIVHLKFGTVEVFNRGDDLLNPQAAYLKFIPNQHFRKRRKFSYQVADMAPKRIVNGVKLDEPEPTHTPRRASTRVRLIKTTAKDS